MEITEEGKEKDKKREETKHRQPLFLYVPREYIIMTDKSNINWDQINNRPECVGVIIKTTNGQETLK